MGAGGAVKTVEGDHSSNLPQDGGIEREFEVSQDGINKTITHLHYTGWPHHGTPEDPAQFVNFIKLIGERRKLVETPVLIHCR